MTLMQVWGALLIFLVCPVIGGLPLIAWITKGLTGRNLAQLGTGNISVSAAFYHGGRWVGILAVLSEAAKGIGAVLLARAFFPQAPAWELIALLALVFGRYAFAKGAGTTNVTWGYVVHDPIVAGLTFLLSGISFTLLRERQQGKLAVLIIFPVLTMLRHPQNGARIGAAIALAGFMAWIYQKIPDDLNMTAAAGQENTRGMFRFFQGNRAILSLDQLLAVNKVGQKAATLAQLRRWGYPVPPGWVLPPGDDSAPLLQFLRPSPQSPLVVRSSAIGEDSEQASAAGQYQTILHVTQPRELQQAIAQVLASYDAPTAAQYRRDRGMAEDAMAVLIQTQVQSVFSGVAFSRDPIARQGDTVLIEALPGDPNQIVSGRVTPETYRVWISSEMLSRSESWQLPTDLNLDMEGAGDVPPRLIQQVAFLARHLEARYHGVPQDIEWTFDGQQLWLLQSRPITTLLPIWTRKIAAEVIPGVIRPLTWSINRPLTCGVWGELFTLVLGDRAQGLDFNETATLHYSRAYFNASLLGQTFRRMGLPAESLEFLTRGAKFSKPPISSTLRNTPGLLRLVQREWRLPRDFQRDDRLHFTPALTHFSQHPVSELSPTALLERIDQLLQLLKRATYYSILAPLSAALRQAIFKIPDPELDNGQTPEVAALRDLQQLAHTLQQRLPHLAQAALDRETLLTRLTETETGQEILQQFHQLLQTYGYLSEVGTDIAVPTWQEDSQVVQELFTQFVNQSPTATPTVQPRSRKAQSVQQRLDLKGRVTAVYSRLLAEVRWSFVALEQIWLRSQLLIELGDIFFLEFSEIRQLIQNPTSQSAQQIALLIQARRSQHEQANQQPSVPYLMYGNTPPSLALISERRPSARQLQGIGASPGQVEGRIQILPNLKAIPEVDRTTILVVPYTDSGWAPVLAKAGGLISEVGGRLSHGAIVAREYGIPAVMDIANATQQFQNGQWVRIDGQTGIVEIL